MRLESAALHLGREAVEDSKQKDKNCRKAAVSMPCSHMGPPAGGASKASVASTTSGRTFMSKTILIPLFWSGV